MPTQPAHRERIAVLTDSCADLPPALAREKGIEILPLKICYPEGDYLDGVSITPEEIYRRMPDEVPKTSLPDGESILGAFDRLRDAGYTKAVAVMFSSGISGTYNAVRVLAESYEDMEIAVFDTKNACMGVGLIALRAVEFIREQGLGWDELLARMPGVIRNTQVFFSIDSLDYLQKGGRIGLVTCVAGTMLQIKPVISFAKDGQLVSIGKARGRAKSMEEVARRLRALIPGDGKPYDMFVANGGCPEDAEALKAMLAAEIAGCRRFYECEIDGTLAAHVGPHLIGLGIHCLEEYDGDKDH